MRICPLKIIQGTLALAVLLAAGCSTHILKRDTSLVNSVVESESTDFRVVMQPTLAEPVVRFRSLHLEDLRETFEEVTTYKEDPGHLPALLGGALSVGGLVLAYDMDKRGYPGYSKTTTILSLVTMAIALLADQILPQVHWISKRRTQSTRTTHVPLDVQVSTGVRRLASLRPDNLGNAEFNLEPHAGELAALTENPILTASTTRYPDLELMVEVPGALVKGILVRQREEALRIAEEQRRRAEAESLRVKQEAEARARAARPIEYADASETTGKGSFRNVIATVVGRMDRGASHRVALGDLKGTRIRWTATPNGICMGMRGEPIEFLKGGWKFLGFPSRGLDKVKVWLFCEATEGQSVIVEGVLTGASDWPDAPLIVEVDGLSTRKPKRE